MKGTPIMNESERAKMLVAIEAVDEVHIYHSLDQRSALSQLNVDIFCVGEEFGIYNEHKVALQYSEDTGIAVTVIKRYPGDSSNELRSRASSRTQSDLFENLSVAVDYHDCLPFDTTSFKQFFNSWSGKVYIHLEWNTLATTARRFD